MRILLDLAYGWLHFHNSVHIFLAIDVFHNISFLFPSGPNNQSVHEKTQYEPQYNPYRVLRSVYF